MREEFNSRYSFIKSSICQGLVWCFWHTLLWIVDSEFTDLRAIPYIISNIVVITSITVLMNIYLIITPLAVLFRNKTKIRNQR
jgi:hypothetical protein